jgi:hypothetical protein
MQATPAITPRRRQRRIYITMANAAVNTRYAGFAPT